VELVERLQLMEHQLEEVAAAVEALVAQVVVMEQLLKVVDRVHMH
tara:strand:- start:235 stop:369 length:135 start_codon:yes stop_codon:yes gene_type:complete